MFVLDAISDTVRLERYPDPENHPDWGYFTLPREVGDALGWKINKLWIEKTLAVDYGTTIANIDSKIPFNVTVKKISNYGWTVGDELAWSVQGTVLTIHKV